MTKNLGSHGAQLVVAEVPKRGFIMKRNFLAEQMILLGLRGRDVAKEGWGGGAPSQKARNFSSW